MYIVICNTQNQHFISLQIREGFRQLNYNGIKIAKHAILYRCRFGFFQFHFFKLNVVVGLTIVEFNFLFVPTWHLTFYYFFNCSDTFFAIVYLIAISFCPNLCFSSVLWPRKLKLFHCTIKSEESFNFKDNKKTFGHDVLALPWHYSHTSILMS